MKANSQIKKEKFKSFLKQNIVIFHDWRIIRTIKPILINSMCSNVHNIFKSVRDKTKTISRSNLAGI